MITFYLSFSAVDHLSNIDNNINVVIPSPTSNHLHQFIIVVDILPDTVVPANLSNNHELSGSFSVLGLTDSSARYSILRKHNDVTSKAIRFLHILKISVNICSQHLQWRRPII